MLDNRLEEKWDMLDEKEQRMIVSYMNNFLSSSDSSNVMNLDDSPARRKISPVSTSTARLVNSEYLEEERLKSLEEISAEMANEVIPAPAPTPAPVAEQKEHKEANPAPLGLIGFGMTTILLNLHNAGIIEMSIIILAMGVVLGGLAQIIAGIMEFRNKNTFGATAFTAYGLFWWSLVFILVNPDWFGAEAATHAGMGFYMVLWCVFTAFLYIGTLKMAVAQRLVFGSLTMLFFLLAVENFSGFAAVSVVAGIVGIFCGCAAIYTAVVSVLNEVYGRQVMPL